MFAVDSDLKKIFANPRQETIEDIIAVGGRLSPELLIYSYNHGIFPWPHEGYPLLWFCPDERGVIDFHDLHLPKSFLKWIKKNQANFKVTSNQNFKEVVKQCRLQLRNGQKGSWINSEIEKNYFELHKQGKALSIEIWLEDRIVGGIYGVLSDKYFSCESMFHLVPNASKFALLHMILLLQDRGFSWMDIQMVTSVCESFGGKLIEKNEFLTRIDL